MFYLTKRYFLAGDVQAVGLGLTATREDLGSRWTLLSARAVSLRAAVQVDTSPISPAGSSHSSLPGSPVVRHHGEPGAERQEGGEEGEDDEPYWHVVIVISATENTPQLRQYRAGWLWILTV